MSEISKYLRYMVQSDKEGVVSALTVTGDTAAFTSQLTDGQIRKRIDVYNNSNANSGDCYYGFSSALTPANGMPLPRSGELFGIPVAAPSEGPDGGSGINIYFSASSGEVGDLRIRELA